MRARTSSIVVVVVLSLVGFAIGCRGIIGLRDDYTLDSSDAATEASNEAASDVIALDAPDVLPIECTDGKKNGAETDVDCGGPVCNWCKNGKVCTADDDCVGGRCSAGKCGGWTVNVPVAWGGFAFRPSSIVDSKGDVYVAYQFTGTTNVGLGDVVSLGTHNANLVKFSHTGKPIWQKPLLGSSRTFIDSLAFDANGKLLVLGSALDNAQTFATFGGMQKTLSYCAATDIGRFDPATGMLEAETVYSSGLYGHTYVAAKGAQALIYGDTTCLPIDNIAQQAGAIDYFSAAVQVGGDGGVAWQRWFPHDGYDNAYSGAQLANGDLVITFGIYPEADGGALPIGDASLKAYSGWDWGIARIDGTNGAPVWAKQFVSPFYNDFPYAVAADPAGGGMFVAGTLGDRDLAGNTVAKQGWVLGKLDASGNPVWTTMSTVPSYTDQTNEYPSGITADPSGRLYAVGSTVAITSFDLGCGAKVTNGAKSTHLVILDANGACNTHVFSAGGSSEADIQLNKGQGVVLAGFGKGNIDLGAGPFASRVNTYDLYVMSLGNVLP